MKLFSILHLEDSLADHELVVHILERTGGYFKFFHVDGLAEFERIVTEESIDLILADFHLAGFSGLDAWDWLQARGIRLAPVRLR